MEFGKPSTLILSLLVLVGMAAAQPKIDAKKIATLEKKVARLQAQFDQDNSSLRETYNALERKLDKAAQENDGAKLKADLKRVLEPVLAKARDFASKSGTANRRKAQQVLKNELPKALEKLELEPLGSLKGYIEARLRSVWSQTANISDALTLSDEDLASKALETALDQTIPFFERWNGGLSESVDGGAPYRLIYKQLAQAKIDLAVAKDPLLAFQIGCDPGFARVPSGAYTLASTSGFNQGYRKKTRRISIDREVWIGLHEVTNEEYLEWIRSLPESERQKHLPRNSSGVIMWALNPEKGENLPPADKMNHPVVGINLKSAVQFAAVRGCRLPTEAEWCAMAGGPDVLPYPWGPNWEADRCNDRESGNNDTTAVGSFTKGRGPFGHYDVAGNVAEWILTYESGKSVDPAKIEDDNVAVRGGSYKDGKRDVSSGWVWLKRALFDRDSTTGFRLARFAPSKK